MFLFICSIILVDFWDLFFLETLTIFDIKYQATWMVLLYNIYNISEKQKNHISELNDWHFVWCVLLM